MRYTPDPFSPIQGQPREAPWVPKRSYFILDTIPLSNLSGVRIMAFSSELFDTVNFYAPEKFDEIIFHNQENNNLLILGVKIEKDADFRNRITEECGEDTEKAHWIIRRYERSLSRPLGVKKDET